MSELYRVLENPESRGWSWLGAGAESRGAVLMKEVEEASLRALTSGTTGNSRGNSQGKAGAHLTDLRRGRRLRVRAGVPADRRGRHVEPVDRCQDFSVQSQQVGSIAAQRVSVVGVR